MTRQPTPPLEPGDAAVARFLAELSHELRTPLGAIVGSADAMRARAFGPLSETYVEHAALIHAGGRHLLDLVGDLADIAAIEAGHREIARERFDAGLLVRETVGLMTSQARAAGVTLDAVIPGEDLTIVASCRDLRQILFNLISNALTATPAGGSVTVTAGRRDGTLTVSVADTGVGMAAGEAERRALVGGVGLVLVRRLCEAHGGTFAIESTPGAGATARVELPAPG